MLTKYSLREVQCPATLRRIEANMFMSCESLISIRLNEGLEMIG